MNKVVQRALVNIYMHVADAVDANDPLPDALREAYLDELEKPEVSAFYVDLVDANNAVGGFLNPAEVIK